MMNIDFQIEIRLIHIEIDDMLLLIGNIANFFFILLRFKYLFYMLTIINVRFNIIIKVKRTLKYDSIVFIFLNDMNI